MSIDPSKTQLVFNFYARDAPDIAQCLKTLFTTPVGTVALDREFGMDFSILDQPMPVAKSKYSAELMQKVRRYEPRVEIREITYEHDAANGILIPKVVVTLA